MKRATKMMLLGNQYNRSRTRNSRDWEDWDMPHMTRDHDSERSMTDMRYRGGSSSLYGGGSSTGRRIGYDANIEDVYDRRRRNQMRYSKTDDDDDEHRRGGNADWQNHRMYAAGVAWAEPDHMHERSRKQYGELDEQCAHKWVARMENADGTTGGHYKPEQAEQLRAAHCPQSQKWEWYVALNMMYSDYAPVGKKLGVDRDEFYAGLAKAFLMDKDAGEHKLTKYMNSIPESSEAA